MRKVFLLGFLAAVPLALAASLQYSVVVNGQVAPDQATLMNGKIYVPLSALKLLGIQTSLKGSTLTLGAPTAPGTSPGGANQRAALEGCIGETLFNGVWRLTVKAVRPISRYNAQQAGYAVQLEWRNGTGKTINALNTGVRSVTMALVDGTTLDSEDVQNLVYKTLPQATGLTTELPFWADSSRSASGLVAPSKLLVEVSPSGANSGVVYSTPTPSFRVRLDCQK